MSQSTIWFESAGAKRFGQTWLPLDQDPIALICIVHGLGEHGGRYADFADTMCQRGFGALAFDLQGHGHSPGWRGCINSFDGLMRDIVSALGRLGSLFPEKPIILYGHSMGGNLVLNYALRHYQPQPLAVIASGSFLRPKHPLSQPFMLYARILAKVLPHYCLRAPVRAEGLSRDRSQQDAYRRDELVHRRISLRLGVAIIDAGNWAIEHAQELAVPSLVLHGSADELTCPDASREFAGRSNALCQLRIFDGFLHDIHRDVGRLEVFDLLEDWIRRQPGIR